MINTAVGYLVIIAALSLGLADVPANAAGYAVGLTISYILNSRWTFRGEGRPGLGKAIRYVGLFLVSYGANLLFILAAGELGYEGNPLVHLAGIGLYAAMFFLGAQAFVFVDRGVGK